MTVNEIITELQKFNPNLEVICSLKDDKILEITEINIAVGERVRHSDNTIGIKYGKSKLSEEFVFLEISDE